MLKEPAILRCALLVGGATLTGCNSSENLTEICGESFCARTDQGTTIKTVAESEDFNTYRVASRNGVIIVYEGNHPQIDLDKTPISTSDVSISREPAELYEFANYYELRIFIKDATWPQYLVLSAEKAKVDPRELERLGEQLSRKNP